MKRDRSTIEKPGLSKVLVAAAALSGISAVVINLQPIIMGALAAGRDVSDVGIGQISAIFIGANSISLCTAPWWVFRWDWRISSAVGILGAVLICFSGMLVTSYLAIISVFLGLGLTTGIVGAVAFASLGDLPRPDRAFGASVLAQAFVPVVASFPLAAWVIPRFGPSGMFFALALVCGTAWAACAGIPSAARHKRERAPTYGSVLIFSPAALPVLVALLGKTLFGAGILGYWYFMERLGASRGVSLDVIGILVTLCSLSAIITAGLISWLDDRFSTLTYIFIGSMMLLVAYALMRVPGQAAYMVSTQVFAMGWGLAQPAFFALIRKVDKTGRLFVVAPATVGLAGVAIGIASGPVIVAFGYWGLMIVSAGVIVSAGLLAIMSHYLGLVFTGEAYRASGAGKRDIEPVVVEARIGSHTGTDSPS